MKIGKKIMVGIYGRYWRMMYHTPPMWLISGENATTNLEKMQQQKSAAKSGKNATKTMGRMQQKLWGGCKKNSSQN